MRWQLARYPEDFATLARVTRPGYFVALGFGALAGAWLFGSINSFRSALFAPSHSIAGALAGGILAVEIWKWRHGVRGSTGSAFVLPICAGLAVGRVGCLFAGLADYTYGTSTGLPWAVDLGDGVARHPVQLYESLVMILFLAVYLRARAAGAHWARVHAFHAMIIVYSSQRFLWEFLKPYPLLVGPFNSFQLLMMGMIVYGLFWWRRTDRPAAHAIL